MTAQIKEILQDKDVILFGGSHHYKIPLIHGAFIVRVNNHHVWQEDPIICPGGYDYTDAVYHGAGMPGPIATFMNHHPARLQFLCQNCGSQYRDSLRVWATLKKIPYFGYATLPGERRERGLDPAKYEDMFKPLIDICPQPFTGISAAFHLLTFPIKSLYLAGFDFYEHLDFTTTDGKRGEHNLVENKCAMRMIIQDGRCKPDEILLNSL